MTKDWNLGQLEAANQRYLKADRRAHALEDELSQMKLHREIDREEIGDLHAELEQAYIKIERVQELCRGGSGPVICFLLAFFL